MNKSKVKQVLDNPSIKYVHLALELVNLKEIEREVIELVDLKGYTQEKASAELDCSVKTIQNHRNKAFNKMSKAWSKEESVLNLLE